jgi:hypothetical protein
MLRLAHTQVSTGGILINDIDDGLPNKTAKRGVGDKNKYQRDGNSLGGTDRSTARDVNNPKQKCYIPYWKIGSNNSIPGYIDVAESDRVLISQDRGVIYGLAHKSPSPLITVTSFTQADVTAPAITSAVVDVGNTYHLTITGTNLDSLAPDISTVTIVGSTTVTYTFAYIAAHGGSVGAHPTTSVVIPEALLPAGIVAGTSTVSVTADNQPVSHAITAANTIPTVATATLSGDLNIAGTGLRSLAPNTTSVIITGTGAVTLTQAQILGVSGGSISDTLIVVKASLIPSVVAVNSHVAVTANTLTSTPVVNVS